MEEHKRRSLSRSRSHSRSPPRRTEITMELDEANEVAFVLGRKGATKKKLERASRCRMDIRKGILTISGGKEVWGPFEEVYPLYGIIAGFADECRRAEYYVRLVLAQRLGDVKMDFREERDDRTLLQVPKDAIGYVTGRYGSGLRTMEAEWSTMMLFVKSENPADEDAEFGILAIFGSRSGRCGSHLKVMSSVEQREMGTYLKEKVLEMMQQYESGKKFGVMAYTLTPEEVSYALGQGGSTRLKLASAAHCILEYVGNVAYIGGTEDERRRGLDYLRWVCLERQHRSIDVDLDDRDDVLEIDVPSSVMPVFTGYYGQALRHVEMRARVYCLPYGASRKRGYDTLLIFGAERRDRFFAENLVHDIVRRELYEARYREERRGRSRSRSRSRRLSRSRSHSSSSHSRSRSRSRSYSSRSYSSRSRSRSRS